MIFNEEVIEEVKILRNKVDFFQKSEEVSEREKKLKFF